jgi:hypothetical protein
MRGNGSLVGSRCVRGSGEHDGASAGSRWTNGGAWVAFCYPAVLGWEVEYRLGPCGMVLAIWAAKVGCSLGQAGMRSGPESRQLGCVIDDGVCYERTGCTWGRQSGLQERKRGSGPEGENWPKRFRGKTLSYF